MTHSDPHVALVQVLSQAERSVSRRLTRVIEAHGGTIEQWRVLSLLADGQGHPMGELADSALVPPPTLTRLVDKMVNDNLVYRRVDPVDRRRVLIFTGARGRRLHARLDAAVKDHEEAIAGGHSDLDLPRLTTLLGQLVERSG